MADMAIRRERQQKADTDISDSEMAELAERIRQNIAEEG
jgi:hypothetical protein